ncbi:hypothetical protein DENSPDRAFT_933057 [Dentipellis sp. KUC8613]|nr:hypothetical protein DENSPDRAFT_933057 [Dentipellis sp. KUC8613]
MLHMQYLVIAGWLTWLEVSHTVYWMTVGTVGYRTEAAQFIARLIDVLTQIHRLGIFHGDIHPDNVGWLLQQGTSDGIPVFLDFGRARKNDHGPSNPQRPPMNDFTPTRMLAAGGDNRRNHIA